MKIHASAEQSAVPPFMHLGYVAASQWKPTGFTGLSLVVTLVGLMLALRTRRGVPPGGRKERTLVVARSGWPVAVGGLLVAVGLVSVPLSLVWSEGTDYTLVRARSDLEACADLLQRHGKNLPQEPGESFVTDLWGQEPGTITDPWGSEYRIRLQLSPGARVYRVVSYGPDGEPDTEDDLVSPQWRVGNPGPTEPDGE